MQTGDDVRIAPTAVFRYPELVTIGSRAAIDDFVVVTTRLDVGSFVHISPHVTIIGGKKSRCVLEDFSGIAPGCRVICASDDFSGGFLTNPMIPEKYRNTTCSTVVLGRFAALGANAILLPGVRVGEGATVGAGSIVLGDLEPWGVYIGSPARRIGTRPRDEVLEKAREFLAECGKELKLS